MNKTEILALIDLLDDPDEDIFQQLKGKLISEGESVISAMESAWENNFDHLRQKRIENIVHVIQFNQLKIKISEWAKLGSNNLLTGAILITRYQFPDFDESEVRDHIEKIKKDVWLELNEDLTALEKVQVINEILFKVHGFSGNKEDYHNPKNSFINKVLQSRKGNPLSLSILYIIIAEQLDIPIYGVNLPEHFVLAYKDADQLLPFNEFEDHHGVFFYINPFSNGTVFGKREIDSFLDQLKLEHKETYYTPCSNIQMMIRMLNNLQHSYKSIGKIDKSKEIIELIKILIKNLK